MKSNTVLTILNTIIAVVLIFMVVTVEHEIKAIKIPTPVKYTVSAPQTTSMSCTGTLSQNITGTTVPTNTTSPTTTLLGDNVSLSSSTPVSLSCK